MSKSFGAIDVQQAGGGNLEKRLPRLEQVGFWQEASKGVRGPRRECQAEV